MTTIRYVILVLVASVPAFPATAGTIRIPILELIGNYTIDSVDGGLPFGKQVNVMAGVSHFGSERATIELKGSITHGRVRGDGVLRQNTEAILDGAFRSWFQPSRGGIELDLGLSLLPEGQFQRNWSFSVDFQPGIDDFPCPGCEPRIFAPAITLSFWPSQSGLFNEIPFLAPPREGDSRAVGDGLIVIEPAMGTITEAYLVIEHRFIPEPSSLAVAAAGVSLGVFSLVQRRCRGLRAQYHRVP